MHWRVNLRSKLADGIGIGLFLVIISFTFELLTQLVYRFLGRPGDLIFALILMAGSVASLEESLCNRRAENERVLLGMFGGILAWLVTEISNQIGSLTLYSDAGIILFILVVLIVWTLWRRGLPLGAKLYMQNLLIKLADTHLSGRPALHVCLVADLHRRLSDHGIPGADGRSVRVRVDRFPQPDACMSVCAWRWSCGFRLAGDGGAYRLIR